MIKDLSSHFVHDPKWLLNQAEIENKREHKQLIEAKMIDLSNNKFLAMHPSNETWNAEHADLLELLFKGNSICRTARLPARSRYLGYVTNTNDQIGEIAALGNETYDVGIEKGIAIETAKEENEYMRLVWEKSAKRRDRNPNCLEQILKPDYKDFFFAHYKEGWIKYPTFPNEKEINAYEYDPTKHNGLLAIALKACDWGKCANEDLRIDHGGSAIEVGKLEMTVNDKPVKEFFDLNGIHALLGEDGAARWEPNANGQYEIALKVKEEGMWFKISSVVLF